MLNFGSGSQIELYPDTTAISLQRGLDAHRLVLPLQLRGTGMGPGTLVELSAELFTNIGMTSCWVATATPQTLTVTTATNAMVYIPLTNRQVIDLTELSAGKPLPLELRVHALLPESKSSTDTTVGVRIPSSTWLDAVEVLGSAVSTTLVIPLPVRDSEQRKAADYLLEARRLLNAGEIDPAITEARQAMERAEIMAKWPPITKADDPRQRSQLQRWRAIWRAAFDQASGAEHADEVTHDFDYSREEAEAILEIAHALLKVAPKPL